MTKLSVNINKIATLRNARGGNYPDVIEAAIKIQKYGADGITIHPRPDERHITYQDTRDIQKVITTEYNIEGNPNEKFIQLVLENKPKQVTLVPDGPDVLTSNAGWDTIKQADFLKPIIALFKENKIRVSLFIDPISERISMAKELGADRIELYTEAYAANYHQNKEKAIQPYIIAAETANKVGLGINAGHDLDLKNLKFFNQQIPGLEEVSIGHALISDALYLGLENTVNLYQRELKD